jgi:UDP-glucose 4-epimerase
MNLGRCLVLGGTGFIGLHLVEVLVDNGFHVRVFSRSSSFPTRLAAVGNRIEYCAGDFHDAQSLASAVKGCDHVYHLIATSVPTTSNRDMVVDANSN